MIVTLKSCRPAHAASADGTTKARASNVMRIVKENVFLDIIYFLSLFLWNKILKLKPKTYNSRQILVLNRS